MSANFLWTSLPHPLYPLISSLPLSLPSSLSSFLLFLTFASFFMPFLARSSFSPLLAYPPLHLNMPKLSEFQQLSLDSTFSQHSSGSIFSLPPSHPCFLKEMAPCPYFSCIPKPAVISLPAPLNYLCQGHLLLSPVNVCRLSLPWSDTFGPARRLFFLIWLLWFYPPPLLWLFLLQCLLFWILLF